MPSTKYGTTANNNPKILTTRHMKMLSMFLIFFAILALGHTYVGWHIYRILPLPTWTKICVIIMMGLACIMLFVGISPLQNRFSMPVATAVYEIGTSWIILLLYLAIAFLVLDLGRLTTIVPASFLKSSWAGTLSISIVIAALFVYANIHYNDKYREEMSIATEKAIGHQTKILLVSDLHVGYHNRRAELAKWIDLLNAEKADAILVAGDIIDGAIRPINEGRMWEEFQRLNAPVYACLGNHEYLSGLRESVDFYQKAGITLLRDSVATLGNDIVIIGRDDRSNKARKNTDDLVKDISTSRFSILLDHQPYNLEESEQAGIDLQFSGHTHHGQVWPLNWVTDALYEKAFGQHQRGNTRYYISSGLGIWGGKFRIGTRSEYVVLTITKVE